MKKIVLFALVMVGLLAAVAAAGPTASDIVISADGGRSLTTGLGSPNRPMLFDIATDGSGWAKFIRFRDGCTDRADSSQIVVKLVVQLRDYTPPRSPYIATGADSVYVDLVTATEVIISR